MSQQRNPNHKGLNKKQRSLLLDGVCWLSGLGVFSTGILGTGMAIAQTSVPEEPTVPSAQDLLAPSFQEAPAPLPPEIVPVEPVIEESQPSISTELEQSTPTTQSFTEQFSQEVAPEYSPLEETASPSPSLVSPNLVNDAEAAFGGGGAYIDSTPYSLGATRSDNPSIVLSERSTGCEAVLQPGEAVPGSICPAPEWVTTSAGNGGSDGSVSLGPVSFSAAGFEASITIPSGENYYNLSIRPPALLGNGNLNLLFPLSIPAAITSAFGWRIHPVTGENRFHSGTDLGAPEGTPVLAAFDGEVAIADFLGGYGLAVVLQHNKGTEESLYAHLSEVFVKPGERVKQGEVIGRVGSTGLSTGPHLHFEFRKSTPQGWVVMDAGATLEYSLAQFVKSLQTAANTPFKTSLISATNFTKALQMAQAKHQPPEASNTSEAARNEDG